MCGIFFCIWNTNVEKKILRNVKESFSLLNHRGPDNQRLLKKDEWAIGHTRLSIIDTSSRSNQPFSDEKQIYFLSFNGEIYNYEELRAFLLDEGIDFKTSSDTEVLFKLLVHKGLEKTLKLIKGMFSFVFFDSEKKKIYGARDHFGQKPFYYSFENKIFSISSEVPPLLNLQSKIEPDLISCRTYLCSNGIIDKDRTFFKNINTLPAGHAIRFEKGKIKINKYFDVNDLHNCDNDIDFSFNSNVAYLDHLFKKSIKQHVISDVPIGVLLSGGIDSTLIYRYALKENSDLKVFTKISPEIEVIPSNLVPKILKKFPTDPNYSFEKKESYLSEAANFVSHTATPARWGGGPPMSNLCKLATSQGTKVLLSGDGVDESCAGYDSHNFLFNDFSDDLFKLHSLLDLDRESQFFDKLKLDSFLQNRNDERKNTLNILNDIKDKKEKFSRAILFQDVGTFLQLCNLPHSDAYSMKESVELRNPFLDLDLMKFILNQPIKNRFGYHRSGFYSKLIFRKLAEKVIGNFINVHKEGTRNFSMYISNSSFWNFENFVIKDIFNLKKKIEGKSLFRYINLEFLFRSKICKQQNYLSEILNEKGIRSNLI